VLAPTSRWLGKRWPAERFATLTQALLGEGAVEAVAVVGSGTERDQVEPVIRLAERDPRVIDLVGKTGVGTLMATIERSSLVVANDSAALHMAVGFDRPMVGLYGPTQIDLVGPYQRESDVIQAIGPPDGGKNRHKDEDLGRKAMEAIGTDRVIAAAIERTQTGAPVSGVARSE
jgi:heptosyltransferase-2